jgi:uncharacterized LabA/DUF88 family protein
VAGGGKCPGRPPGLKFTGDSDFSPLVSKLKENNKRVLGCGVRSSTSDLLANNCDEFILLRRLNPRVEGAAQNEPLPPPAEFSARRVTAKI